MEKCKKILAVVLCMLTIFSAISVSATDVSKEDVTYIEASSTGSHATEITASKNSSYTVTIPQTIILDGGTKTAEYIISVNGDLSGADGIRVTPSTSFMLSSFDKDDVEAFVTQDKTEWTHRSLDKNANGIIEAEGLTAGIWNGTLYFEIEKFNRQISVVAKDENGNDLNATAGSIVGDEKDILLDKLVESGLVQNAKDIDALIEVESDDFEGLADTTFDVSNIAQPGDKVVILHFNEETNEWEHVANTTVNENGKVTADFSSYSPVAFVVVKEDGSMEIVIPQEPVVVGSATFDDGTILTWEELRLEENGQKYGYTASAITDAEIGEEAFFENQHIKNIILPNSLTKIDRNAFMDSCIENITISNSVTEIGFGAFVGCHGLTSIDIPGSITMIGDEAFAVCYFITNVTIHDGVQAIGYGSFMECENLASVTVSDSVTSIGKNAFSDCISLTNITFEGTKEQWDSIVKDDGWNYNCNQIVVTCTDFTITIPAHGQ